MSDPTPEIEASGVFSRMAALWVVVVGVLSALAFLVLTAYAPELRLPRDGGAHALSGSAIGFAGVIELMQAEGAPVQISRSPHPEREGRASLRVMTPGIDLKPKAARTALAHRVQGEIDLIVLPKWTTTPQFKHPGWVDRNALVVVGPLASTILQPMTGADWASAQNHLRGQGGSPTLWLERRQAAATPVLAGDGSVFGATSRVPLATIQNFQAFTALPTGWAPALFDEKGRTVLAVDANRTSFVLSDPDILNTQGLTDRKKALAASVLLNALRAEDQQPIVFDVTLNGFVRSRDILRLMFEPPFLAATLCLLAAALLTAVHASVRFGAPLAPQRPFAFGKRTLADNSAALIRMAHQEKAMVQRYAAMTRDLVARRIGAPAGLDDSELTQVLDRVGRGKGLARTFTDLDARARSARRAPEILKAVQDLYRWRQEMTRGFV